MCWFWVLRAALSICLSTQSYGYQMCLQFSTSLLELFVSGAYSSKSECLAIRDGTHAVSRVAARWGGIGESAGFVRKSVWRTIPSRMTVVSRNFLTGPLCCELDGWVEGIYFLQELLQLFFAIVPDCEHVIYVPPPDA